MIDALIILTPLLLLAIVALLGFIGCGELHGVTAVAADDVWTVGYSVDLDSPTIYSTLALHWDGSSWKQVTKNSPASLPVSGSL